MDISDLLTILGANNENVPTPTGVPTLGSTDVLNNFLDSLRSPGAAGAPPGMMPDSPQSMAPTHTSQPPMTLPPLPESGGIFHVPVLGPILDTARDLLVGPGADHLQTQEQITRGILNTIVLAKNPGALPALRQGYSTQDTSEYGKYNDPQFRNRVAVLTGEGYQLPEDQAIARAADEYQIDPGLSRPKSLRELPAVSPVTQYKYDQSSQLNRQASTIRDTRYKSFSPEFTDEEVTDANHAQAYNVPLTDQQKQILIKQAAWKARTGGMQIDKAVADDSGIKVTYKPDTGIPYVNGVPTDPVTMKPIGPPTGGAPGMPATQAAQPAQAAQPGAIDTTTGQPAAEPLTQMPTRVDQLDPHDPNYDKFHDLLSEEIVTKDIGPDGNFQYVGHPKTPAQILADHNTYRDAWLANNKDKLSVANKDAEEANINASTANAIVGSYTKKNGQIIDTNGNPWNPSDSNSTPAGTGIYQFLNKDTFPVKETHNPTTIWGNVSGIISSKYDRALGLTRSYNTTDPKNYNYNRYNQWKSLATPNMLIAAGVKRTSVRELDIIGQAFPDNQTLPLAAARKVAAQMPEIMAARAAIANRRVYEVEHHMGLTPYPDIVIDKNTVIPGGNPPLSESDLSDINKFATSPTASSVGAATEKAAPTTQDSSDESDFNNALKGR